MQIHVHYIYCFASFYIICIEYMLVKVKIWINVWCVKLSNLYSVISQHSSSYQITLPKLRKWLSFTKELETHFVSRWCTSYFSVFDQSFFILALAITHTRARTRSFFIKGLICYFTLQYISKVNILGKQVHKQQKMSAEVHCFLYKISHECFGLPN